MSHTWEERANYMMEERDKLKAEVERFRKLAAVVDIYLYSQTELGRDPDGVLREALDAASGRDGGSDGVS